MILHDFPDLTWLKTQAEQRFVNQKGWGGQRLQTGGWPTVILNTHTHNVVRDNVRGPLSLFTNISGNSVVTAGGKRVKVNEHFFFLSNPDQRYTLEADAPKTVETFNIHFGEQFAESVLSTLLQGYEQLLDDRKTDTSSVAFHNKLYVRDTTVENAIVAIRENENDSILVDEQLTTLIEHLLQQHQNISTQQRALPSLKASTKEEIIKRLHDATDYIYTFYYRDLSLDELAGVACLSKFHFLRLFKIAFNQTPHQFINAVRVQRAKALLKSGTSEVRIIAKSLGFLNPGSFSRMFHQHTGLYPTQYLQGS